MMKKINASLLALSIIALSGCNDDDNDFIAESNVKVPTLVSFAQLDVETYAAGPNSGSAVKGANGIFPLFKGQPVQGFSGICQAEYTLADPVRILHSVPGWLPQMAFFLITTDYPESHSSERT